MKVMLYSRSILVTPDHTSSDRGARRRLAPGFSSADAVVFYTSHPGATAAMGRKSMGSCVKNYML